MMMAFFTILSLVALPIGLAAHGEITPETAALWLLGLVMVLAIGRAMGSGLISTLFRVAIPVLSIAALTLRYADSESAAMNLIAQLCSLGLSLFGIYLMVSGPFAGKKTTREKTDP